MACVTEADYCEHHSRFTGNPIKPDKKVLSENIANAHITSVRNPRPNSVASTITPQRLAGLLRSVVDGNNPQDYMTLAEEIEERDLHYASVLRTRKLAVAALPPSVEAASDDAFDKKLADEVRQLMESDQIPELFFDLLDGLGKGMGYARSCGIPAAAAGRRTITAGWTPLSAPRCRYPEQDPAD